MIFSANQKAAISVPFGKNSGKKIHNLFSVEVFVEARGCGFFLLLSARSI